MLAITRRFEEAIYFGDEETVHIRLTADDLQALHDSDDPKLADLAMRLLAAKPGIIEVMVNGFRSNGVSLACNAPKNVDITRKEVYDTRVRERQQRGLPGIRTGT